jgi:ribonuclease HI
MESKLLSVYTDASADMKKGAIAFSVWDNQNCLGRFSSVLKQYTIGKSSVLELIAIRTALIWVSENFPGKKIKLVTDSDTAFRYINFKNWDKEPYRSIADEIIGMDLIEHIECIKSHTHIKRPDYLRNADVDKLAGQARENNYQSDVLISHSTDVILYKQRELDDDTDLLKPVDAKKLVKRYYVEKETPTETVHTARTAIVSNIKSDMTQMEKYAARFKMFKK